MDGPHCRPRVSSVPERDESSDRKWPMIFLGVLTLWSTASFLFIRFGLDIDGRAPLPTQSFFRAGTGRVLRSEVADDLFGRTDALVNRFISVHPIRPRHRWTGPIADPEFLPCRNGTSPQIGSGR